MRRYWVVALAVLTLLGVLSPPAFAQAPAPKVTINGLIDTVTYWARNVSHEDRDFSKNDDNLWYSRNRGRFDIIGEVGKAKGVLGIELDVAWGVTAQFQAHPGSLTTPTSGTGGGSAAIPSFINQSFGAGNDTNDLFEVKWLYVEFPMPLVPVPTIMRLGGQTCANYTYKLAILSFTDCPGVALETTWTPAVKTNLAFMQFDEMGVGITGRRTANQTPFRRGDDFFIWVSGEVTPMKGLDVQPLYVYALFKDQVLGSGNNSSAALPARGGVTLSQLMCGSFVGVTAAAVDSFASPRGRCMEERHYLGVDARWRMGPWSLDPTFIYQTGQRDVAQSTAKSGIGGGRVVTQDEYAWIVDVRGGYRVGPLNLEGFFVYSPGNSAEDNIGTAPGRLKAVKYYQPLNNDIAYGSGGGLSEFLNLNSIDYFRGFAVGTSMFEGGSIGFDRYGRWDIGFKPSYAVTPALTVRGLVAGHWTAESVDKNAHFNAATGLFPAPRGSQDRNSNYLGTEFNLGLTWAFAPGLRLDAGAGWLSPGGAVERCRGGNTATAPGLQDQIVTVETPCTDGHSSNLQDAYWSGARVRFTF